MGAGLFSKPESGIRLAMSSISSSWEGEVDLSVLVTEAGDQVVVDSGDRAPENPCSGEWLAVLLSGLARPCSRRLVPGLASPWAASRCFSDSPPSLPSSLSGSWWGRVQCSAGQAAISPPGKGCTTPARPPPGRSSP